MLKMRQLSPGQANLISSEPNKSLAAMASSPSLLRVSTPFYRGFLTKMDIGYIHIVDLKTFAHMGTHPFLIYIIIHSTSFQRESIYFCCAFFALGSVNTNRMPISATAPAQINAVDVPTILANKDAPTDPVPKPIIVKDRIVPKFFVPNR